MIIVTQKYIQFLEKTIFNKDYKMKTFREICDLSFRDYLKEIISGDDFKSGTDYKKKFMNTFDGDKYKDILGQITLNDKNDYNRRIAIKRLTDKDILGQIALNDKNDYNREIAIQKLTDKDILQNIIDKTKYIYIIKDRIEAL